MNRFTAILLCTLFTGCCTSSNPGYSPLAESAGHDWIRTELFFGLAKTDGSVVGAEEWNIFLDERILRRFPEGLTVLEATGRYLDNQKRTVKEPSKVVILFYTPDQMAAANSNITLIVTEYCLQFGQESVLRTDSISKASFPSAKSSR
jgi:hypothetical protein